MRRLATILGLALVPIVVVAAIATTWRDAPPLVAAGRTAYGYRSLLDVHPPEGRTVVWMGDSTIIGPKPSYVDRIRDGYLKPAGIRSDLRAWVGIGFQDYYCAIDHVADARPDLLVLVANTRVIGASGGPFGDLCSALPLAELPRAAALPWHANGLSLPRLLVLRVLDWAPAETALYWYAGLRERVRNPSWAEAMTKPEPTGAELVRITEKFQDVVVAGLAAYDAPLSARRPMLAFADAAVRLAVARGLRVLVVVSPVPVETLRARGWYRDAVWRHRIDVLRRTVERVGGRLVDLHDAAPDAGFSDLLGHLGNGGTHAVADRLGPIVRAMADEPAAPRMAQGR